MTGIELIAKERQEQLKKHGRSIDSAVKNNGYHQLSEAASLLCTHPKHTRDNDDITEYGIAPLNWDTGAFKKIMEKHYKDRLIIAGALIAAEIDRLLRISNEK